MAPEMSTKIFSKKEINYNLRNSTMLQGRIIKIVMYGSETISILGPSKIWDILPIELKNIVSPTLFKKKICERAQKNYLCLSCKTYIYPSYSSMML